MNPNNTLDLVKFCEAFKRCTWKDHYDSKRKRVGAKKNCHENPLCIFGLGEHKGGAGIWGQMTSLKTLEKSVSSPRLSRDPDQQPAGLKNLGATCYMNSLLQTLFHNDMFRKLVYEWRPTSAPDSPSFLHAMELQKLFVSLDISNAVSIDPGNFVDLLQLQTQIQQDAQEFNKLLLDHLSRMMPQTSLSSLFQGELEYINTCSECHTSSSKFAPFLELELPIKNEVSLEVCLENMSKEEAMCGDNQYLCATCQKKVNAKRKVEICKLPPVLNLQLLRFVFDANTQSKRKIKDVVAIPPEITLKGNRYVLKAVLFHKGTSANSGHYIAEIVCRDQEWWTFNDDVVELKNQLKRSHTKNSSSGDAYMVVYHHVPSGEDVNSDIVDCRQLALPSIVQQVEEENNHTRDVHLQLATTKAELEKVAVARKLLYDEWFLGEKGDERDESAVADCVFVPTQWLVNWISGEPQNTPTTLFDQTIDYTPFVCQLHGSKLDFELARTQMKLLPRDILLAIAPHSDSTAATPDLCKECFETVENEHAKAKREMLHVQEWDQFLAAKCGGNSSVDPSLDTSTLCWISKKWVKECRERGKNRLSELKEQLAAGGEHHSPSKRVRLEKDQDAPIKNNNSDDDDDVNADLVCAHKVLLPKTKALRKLIAQSDWEYLVKHVEFGRWSDRATYCPFDKEERECEQCQRERLHRIQKRNADRLKIVTDFALKAVVERRDNFPREGTLVPMPRSFMDAFRAYFSHGDVEEEESPDLKVDLSIFFCPHFQLVFHPRSLAYLRKMTDQLFPSSEQQQQQNEEEEEEKDGEGGYGVELEWITLPEWEAVGKVLSPTGRTLDIDLWVKVHSEGGRLSFSTDLCTLCCDHLEQELAYQRMVFDQKQVFISRLGGPPPPPPTNNSVSSRNRRSHLRLNRHPVTISSSDTVGALKKKSLAVSHRKFPDARLVFRGQPLEDESLTLEMVGICVGDDVHYEYMEDAPQVVAQVWADGEDSLLEGERGFHGTALGRSFESEVVEVDCVSPKHQSECILLEEED